jgi:hypothetical protein
MDLENNRFTRHFSAKSRCQITYTEDLDPVGLSPYFPAWWRYRKISIKFYMISTKITSSFNYFFAVYAVSSFLMVLSSQSFGAPKPLSVHCHFPFESTIQV